MGAAMGSARAPGGPPEIGQSTTVTPRAAIACSISRTNGTPTAQVLTSSFIAAKYITQVLCSECEHARIEVGHGLILSESAQSIDRVSRGCEHLLAEGVRHWASVRAACVVFTGGPFLWDGLRYPATYLSRKTQGPFPGPPDLG